MPEVATVARLVSDQPSWGRRSTHTTHWITTRTFQTNPRGVGGTVRSAMVVGSNTVSDQPSWGRRIHGARLRIGEMC